MVEANESTRPRIESVTKKNHEDHIAGKGQNSMSQYNLVQKLIPMPQGNGNSRRAKASKVRGTKLRIGEQKDSATVQSLNPLSN